MTAVDLKPEEGHDALGVGGAAGGGGDLNGALEPARGVREGSRRPGVDSVFSLNHDRLGL